jgi:uncharacterized HAD superfamily protein
VPERKLRIGIDIDDVLLQSAKRSIEMYNESFGTDITLDDWYDFDDPEVWSKIWGNDDMKVLVSRVVATMADEAFNSVEPIDGASEALTHLSSDGHELFAVTGRSESIRKQTAFVLDQCFPGIFSNETLFFVDHYAHDGQKASKVDVGLQLGITHFVEDLPAHASGLSRAGIQTILFSPGYRWNKAGVDEDVAGKVIVLDSWPKIVEHLDAESAR